MHYMDLPAGSSVRLHATAGPDVALHRWAVRVLDNAAAPGAPALLTFGSRIGAGDCEQRVDIPAQARDCRLEVWASHAAPGGWKDDRCTVEDDTPDGVEIGFSDRALPQARKDDVRLSFTLTRAKT
jgi:hypothetical protein